MISGGLYTSDQGQGSISDAAHADRADYADRSGVATRAEEADHAKTSDVADLAKDLTPDSPVNDRFIRKDQDDRTPYGLSVGGELVAENGARSRDFMSGMNGFGWGTDKRGNFSVESMEVRSFMRIMDLIVNRQRTIEGDTLLSEGDTIEEVIPMGVSDEGNPRYTLRLHEEWDGYTTAQYEGNVIRGIYNDLTGAVSGDGVTQMNNASYFLSWMRVLDVRPFVNEVDVVLYPDDEVPAGRNFPPRTLMKFARWGNAGGTEEQLKRQSVIYLSSSEGRIMKYYHVTKPIVGPGNVAFCLGKLPDFLAGINGLNLGEEAAYIENVVAQRFTEVNHQGLPDPVITFRGEFDRLERYYDGTEVNEETQKYEWSCVMYFGCQWLCAKGGTRNPPSWDSTDWILYLGDPRLVLELGSDVDAVDADNPEITFEGRASIYYQDITDDPRVKWDWTRKTVVGGVEDTASDAIWNAAHEDITNRVTLRREDLNYSFGRPPESCVITLTATLIDKSGMPMQTAHGPLSETREVEIA